jgi:hypothetical protein
MLHAPRHHNIAEISPYPLLRLRKLDTERGRVKADQRRKLAASRQNTLIYNLTESIRCRPAADVNSIDPRRSRLL